MTEYKPLEIDKFNKLSLERKIEELVNLWDATQKRILKRIEEELE